MSSHRIHRIVRSVDLSEMLSVPKVTLRHDLEWLEKQVFLERTHGGTILDQRVRLEPRSPIASQPTSKRNTYWRNGCHPDCWGEACGHSQTGWKAFIGVDGISLKYGRIASRRAAPTCLGAQALTRCL